MTQWEYHFLVFDCDVTTDAGAFPVKCTALGRAGWEMFHMETAERGPKGQIRAAFKRPVADAKKQLDSLRRAGAVVGGDWSDME
ncbi:MAG: hypothetical protein KGL39_07585 [Patescibacteria group bacterium]|nr:hypothetical protein [Patescibacteria group bacterium]